VLNEGQDVKTEDICNFEGTPTLGDHVIYWENVWVWLAIGGDQPRVGWCWDFLWIEGRHHDAVGPIDFGELDFAYALSEGDCHFYFAHVLGPLWWLVSSSQSCCKGANVVNSTK